MLYRGGLKPNPQDSRLTFISYRLLGQEADPAIHFQNCKNCLGKVINLNTFSYHNLKILEFTVCKKKKKNKNIIYFINGTFCILLFPIYFFESFKEFFFTFSVEVMLSKNTV